MNELTPPLASLLNMSTILSPVDNSQVSPQDNNPIGGDTASLMPSFAAGGMIGPGGTPVRPNIPGMPGVAGPSAGGMGPQQMELEARRFVQQNPEQVAQISEAVQEALADGDITMDQVKILSNMAKVAIQNPEMYPQLKRAVVQQGILEEDELPPDYDQGTMFVLLLIGQIIQAPAAGPAAGGDNAAPAPGGDQMMGQAGGMPMPSMASGGALPARSPNNDGSVPINAHEGEYVIPSHVVRAKGTEFFDKLVQSYTQQPE